MNWIRVAAFILFSAPAMAQSPTPAPVPDWLGPGVKAALDDPTAAPWAAVFLSSADISPRRAASLIDVDTLLKLLGEDQESNVRQAAAFLLGYSATGESTDRIIDSLLPLLRDDQDGNVREAAATALGQIATDKSADRVIEALLPLVWSENDNGSRAAAVSALGQIARRGQDDRVVDKLLPFLNENKGSNFRQGAAFALGQIASGKQADRVTPELLTVVLRDKAPFVQVEAITALGRIATGERAGPVVDQLLLLLRDETDGGVRAAAVSALGQIATGNQADSLIDKLLSLLRDQDDGGIRRAAASALGQIATGARADRVIDPLFNLLGGTHFSRGFAAASTLGQIATGDHADKLIGELLPTLQRDPEDGDLRYEAVLILGKIATGERAARVFVQLVPFLGDPDSDVRYAAASVLGKMAAGQRGDRILDKLLSLLGDQRSDVRQAVAAALGQIATGSPSDRVVDKLLLLLRDPALSKQIATASILGSMAPGVIDSLLLLLSDPHYDVRQAAATAFGQIGTGARTDEVIAKLLPLLGDPQPLVQRAAASTLGHIVTAERTDLIIDKLIPLLGNRNSDVRAATELALGEIATGNRDHVIDQFLRYEKNEFNELSPLLVKVGPGDLSTTLAELELIDESDQTSVGQLRLVAHIAGAGDEQSEQFLKWLGKPKELPLSTIADDPEKAYEVLHRLADRWGEIVKWVRLTDEAESAVVQIVNTACHASSPELTIWRRLESIAVWVLKLPLEGPAQRCWTTEQRKTLHVFLANSKKTQNERELANDLSQEDAAHPAQWITLGVVGWAVVFASFLFLFPRSRTAQAAFFWNPKVRSYLSFGVVPLLLFVIPALRRRLLAPARDNLTAAARLRQFPELGFFGQAPVRVDKGPPAKAEDLLPTLKGTVIIRGDAGSGKTSTLRWLAANASGPVAFLSARDCTGGVETMIARLIYDVQDTGFVRSTVYAGILTVMIDDLNEVSAETRDKIGSFARDMSKGNIFLGTQPITWEGPPDARIVDLLPLNRTEAESFLLSRLVGDDEKSACHGRAYVDAVHKFLRVNLDEAPSDDERRSAELTLSSPFDLAFAADLLAQGAMPTAAGLIDEAFRLADQDHRQVAGSPFPLVPFGRRAVDMRIEDRNWFKLGEFDADLPCLLQRRLVVSRIVSAATGAEEKRIQFRHGRVWDFFIAAAFAADSALMQQHFGDPRFRGSYSRIAETWPLDDAFHVREQLLLFAAQTGDHATSDEFIKRLEARRQPASQPQHKQSAGALEETTTA